VRLQVIGKLKKFDNLIGTRSSMLPLVTRRLSHLYYCVPPWLGAMLRAGRSLVLFLIKLLDLTITLIFPATLWPRGTLSL
jgi:hypothetical protein